MAQAQQFMEEGMNKWMMRLKIGSFGPVRVCVEPIGRSALRDGQHIIETITLRVTTDEGFLLTTDNLERMNLSADDTGAREVAGLCSRMRGLIFSQYFSAGMQATQGLYNLLCAHVEESGDVRVTFSITCHSSAGG